MVFQAVKPRGMLVGNSKNSCPPKAQTWRLHTKLYKFGWHTSANNSRMKNSRDLIIDEVDIMSVIYRIQDSLLYSLNGYDF